MLDQLQRLLGRPAGPPTAPPTPLEEAVEAAADRGRPPSVLADLTALFPALIETPLFRLAGTEEAIRQVLALAGPRPAPRSSTRRPTWRRRPRTAFDLLAAFANYQTRRPPS